MIEAINLGKSYGAKPAVAGLNFSIEKGVAVGLLGLNGAGKTTTLSMLATILSPTAGSISICGHLLPRENRAAQLKLGFLPDTPPLYGDMLVHEYLSYIGRLRGLKGKQLKLALESVIEKCNLQSVSNALCGNISRGFAQRVGLAQALIHDPEVLILDEPTTGLDPEQVLEIRQLLVQLARSKAMIFSSHILSEVEEVCSRVLIIHGGKIQADFELSKLPQEENLEKLFIRVIDSPSVMAKSSEQEAA